MTSSTSTKMKTLDMAYIGLFAVVIAICSWISIPTVVPFTLQTFAVFLAVAVLGGKRGTLSVIVYVLLGAVGLPVFSGFKGGIGVLLNTTGGYIIGFIFSALLMWAFEKAFGRKAWALILSMILALALCYAFGTIWFMIIYANNVGAVGLSAVLGWCVIPFIIPDLIKIALAFILSRRISRSVTL
ncbi:biotin transporter BioY [Frisingicoccus caecimuris]|uniref:Biotin transporter n=1 Tax=Frisingicoccus caecimuris TaxID=1796636 RepID=A0A4R2LLI6_9FIRM|nr:biotin transporter BioY [Frisingicoccus caecimuris]MCR1917882.1 biotin transporter BioY [Frisingicoccus caecimuris]TCO86567.1 biotin transport system substrate-specific component [Frisingicoccus caecimuris]